MTRARSTTAVTALLAAALIAAAPAPVAAAATPAPTPPRPTDGIDDGPLAPAQDPQIAAQAAAMRKLSFFVGTWRGAGWMATPKGKSEFTMLEVVRPKLSGQILLVEGKGVSARDPKVITHRALALAGYDPAKKQYTWHAYSQGAAQTTMHVGARSWRWELPMGPGMTMRYRASFTNRTWSEVGEMSRDGGKTWTPVMQFTLKKQVGGR